MVSEHFNPIFTDNLLLLAPFRNTACTPEVARRTSRACHAHSSNAARRTAPGRTAALAGHRSGGQCTQCVENARRAQALAVPIETKPFLFLTAPFPISSHYADQRCHLLERGASLESSSRERYGLPLSHRSISRFVSNRAAVRCVRENERQIAKTRTDVALKANARR